MQRELRLGTLTLQPRRQLLLQGQPVPLGRKALDILSTLAEADGELVTKDELLSAVWPDVIVEENALQVHVAALRRALGAEAERLSTVRGLGYRLDTAERARAAAGPDKDEARVDSLAVLPFTNLTGDPAKEYLSDGLAAELIATMARGSGLRLPSWTSSRAYKDKALDVRQIGRELGVDSVLEGEVKAGATRIRVHAQLIDVATGFHRWSDSFDRTPSDLLELQEELAAAISAAVRAHLTPLPPASTSSEAFDLYLKGRALENSPSHANFRQAADLYRRAVAIDGGFALALSRLAAVLCMGQAIGTFPPQSLDEAGRAAERAIASDPFLASGHASLASVCLGQGNWSQADASHKWAIDCGPADAQALMQHGSFLATAGYLTHARKNYERAAQLEPTNTRAALMCANFYSLSGNAVGCAKWLENAIALGSSPDEVPISSIRAKQAMAEGDAATATRLWVSGLPQSLIDAGFEPVCAAVMAAHLGVGSREQALEALEAFWASCQGISSPMTAFYLWFYALLDDLDGAYRVADHLVRQLHGSGHLDEGGARMLWTHDMDSFREDPRFAAYVEGVGLMGFWRRDGWPDLWSPAGSRPLYELVREWNAAA